MNGKKLRQLQFYFPGLLMLKQEAKKLDNLTLEIPIYPISNLDETGLRG
jgi:hypothetical protein